MIPVYICEDNSSFRALLTKEIKDYILIQNHDMQVVCATDKPQELLSVRNEHTAGGIFFLDIDLGDPEFDGFDLAKKLRENDRYSAIIFVTSHGELGMEAFRHRLEAMDYILKDDMDNLRGRVRSCIDWTQKSLERHSSQQTVYFTAKVFDTVYNIPLGDILYFETSTQKHRICLHAVNDILEFPGKLQEIEERVGAGFLRCHRSYLVNREHIRAIHSKEGVVELDNGERCLLSRKMKGVLGR